MRNITQVIFGLILGVILSVVVIYTQNKKQESTYSVWFGPSAERITIEGLAIIHDGDNSVHIGCNEDYPKDDEIVFTGNTILSDLHAHGLPMETQDACDMPGNLCERLGYRGDKLDFLHVSDPHFGNKGNFKKGYMNQPKIIDK